jgi:hypothetical protein
MQLRPQRHRARRAQDAARAPGRRGRREAETRTPRRPHRPAKPLPAPGRHPEHPGTAQARVAWHGKAARRRGRRYCASISAPRWPRWCARACGPRRRG